MFHDKIEMPEGVFCMQMQKKNALVITLVYSGFGVSLILLSDWFFYRIYDGIEDFVYFSVIKGLLFVLLSTLILFSALSVYLNRHQEKMEKFSAVLDKQDSYERFYENQKTLLINIIKKAPVPQILHTEDQQFLAVSLSLEKISGYTLKEIPSIGSWVKHLYPNDPDTFMNHAKKLYDIDDVIDEGPTKLISKQGAPFYLHWHTAFVGYNERGLKMMVSTGIDITEQKTRKQELTHLSYIDELSGLYNRRYFQEISKQYETRENVAIVAADINGLKLVNDIFGHKQGDTLIKRFGTVLQTHFPKHSHIVRIGGDEFIVLIEDYASHNIQALCNTVKDAFKESSKDYFASVALGVSVKQKRESINQGVSRAENGLYHDKIYEYHKDSDHLIENITKMMFRTTDESKAHIEQLKAYASPLKKALNLSKDKCDELDQLIELHDVGKVSIDSAIFEKQGPLNPEEKNHMMRHSEIGYRIASMLPKLKSVAYPILTHHENLDGSGYPLGLEGDAIPLTSRIFRVLDTYSTMISNTSNGDSVSKEEAYQFITYNSGALFDETIVNAFVETLKEKWA